MTNRWTGPLVLLGYALIWMLVATAVHGQSITGSIIIGSTSTACPLERPIRKTVDSGFATCTLVACVGKLVCPPDVAPGMPECYRMPASDCNTCTRSVTDICLSQEELDRAR